MPGAWKKSPLALSACAACMALFLGAPPCLPNTQSNFRCMYFTERRLHKLIYRPALLVLDTMVVARLELTDFVAATYNGFYDRVRSLEIRLSP